MDSKLGRRHETLGILCGAAGLLCGLSLFTYDQRGGENWIGPFGEGLARTLAVAVGWAAWLVPCSLFFLMLAALKLGPRGSVSVRVAATLASVLLGCALLHLYVPVPAFGGHLPGGALGELLGELLRSLLGLLGAGVVCVTALAITLILSTPLSFVGVLQRTLALLTGGNGSASKWLRKHIKQLMDAWRAAQKLEQQKRAKPRTTRAPKKPKPPALDKPEKAAPARLTPPAADELDDDADGDEEENAAILVDELEREDEDEADDALALDDDVDDEPEPVAKRSSRDKRKAPVIVAPKIDAPRTAALSGHAPRMASAPASDDEEPKSEFVLPPTTLLEQPPSSRIVIDEPALLANADLLVEKLAAYGVKGQVRDILPGPVVTMYEFEPQSGTKISKIAGLADDLAMALAAQKVRIVAPIPGKARVGFELPNEQRQTVYLRELLEDERWRNLQAQLPMALGKDIVGHPVYCDMAKMPHLLVAGATGSGKSVGLNVMLASLLMKKTPDEVRLLMIDPKVVELAVFDGIPHMLLPVVTDMKKASLALRWAVDEMERRYQLFADAGARNLLTYNARVEKVLSGEMSVATFAPRRVGKVRALGTNGEEMLLDTTDGEHADAEDFQPELLPTIVLVVDEYADLMMVAAKDVEAAIARLAQKARAAGIHVILATQRPSVDVITGMIKANFPSRIGYKVSQREDSKTILGRTGAEHLLGLGDMLCIMPGSNDLKRVHSAFISEDEVKELCDYLRAQGTPVYDDNILKPRDDEEDPDSGGPMVSDDPLYDRAVAIVAQAGYCSISHIQRNLSVGYNKAAKLVERMEKEGVVGPASGKAGGRREVFIEAR